ncbi:MaoC/PaaZ C-terminal domain-containing protein [Streptomyces xiaopingdaonensis]|uniref:MaoC/PaaZ C-terminal domain-containing protein n=1 Tax=Streptomyces xiaopingdaonensis TaxID=1565415 RepID=UPI00031C0981|nr:MaoC/PaaZ C-terminal domain-containing protein [Streptomyces xiaopingdaonensis]
MPIDAERALAAEPTTARIAWDHKDVQLYHLGLGAGTPALDPQELRYLLEDRLHVLPTFATVAGGRMNVTDALSTPGLDVDLAGVLHGGQLVRVHRPLPMRGDAEQTSRIVALHDKGKAAVLVIESAASDAEGPLWEQQTQLFLRGEGGFGGERGPSERIAAPEREPDTVVEKPIREDQALLYRLSGDWNPLHADPEFAALAGFDRPILHGLSSYGMALKAVVDSVLGGDPTRVRSYRTRFAGVVFPGETLRVRLWHVGEGRVQLTATAVEREDATVLADTVVEHT